MKLNKILFVLMFPFLAEFAVSCCSCIDTVTGRYTNKAISIDNIDNSGTKPLVTAASAISKKAYGIRVKLDREKTACVTPSPSLFVSSAYAFSCDCPPALELSAKDSITKIQIFTINEFDANHAANSDISTYFKIFEQGFYSNNTISEFLIGNNRKLNNNSELISTPDFLLMTPPSINKTHSFKIVITLSDGRSFEEITNSVDLI